MGGGTRGLGVLIPFLVLAAVLLAVFHFAPRHGGEFIGMSQTCRSAPQYCGPEQTEEPLPSTAMYGCVAWPAVFVIALAFGAADGAFALVVFSASASPLTNSTWQLTSWRGGYERLRTRRHANRSDCYRHRRPVLRHGPDGCHVVGPHDWRGCAIRSGKASG
jgi:hypothetical protein